MPKRPLVDMPQEELAARRHVRSGSLRALHLLVWCAVGRTPTDIGQVLLCSRSRVHRTVRAYREGTLGLEHDEHGRLAPPGRTTVRLPTLRRARVAWLKAPPRASGWCRTRWSGATLAMTWQATRGIAVAAETMRRWVHAVGWVWKRATRVAQDPDPHRVARLARLRFLAAPWRLWEALVLADERALHWRPKGGYAWLPHGTQLEVMTPGTHEKHDLAGALDLATGTLPHGCGPRQPTGLVRDVRQTLEDAYPAAPYQRIDVVVEHDKLHHAKAVEPWWATHPRVTRLLVPT